MSSLKARMQADLTASMRAGKDQEIVKSTLRMALAAVMNAEVAGAEAVELSDEQVLRVVQAEAKKRAESAEIYDKAGRAEAAAKELAELAVLEAYLPAAISDDELAVLVSEEVANAAAAGNSGPKAMGAVVKAVRERAGSSVDGGKVAAMVKTALS
jgi:uncharacterized protein YqeY